MDHKYIYLIGSLITLMEWTIIFLLNKNLKKEMLFISFITIPFGLLCEYIFFTQDWWDPQTVTGTRLGAEDVIFTFSLTGITSCVYLVTFGRNLKAKEINFSKILKNIIPKLLITAFIGLTTAYVTYKIFNIHSLIANFVGFIAAGIFLIFQNTHTVKVALFTAIALPLIILPVHTIMDLLSPTFVEQVWNLENLSGIIILGAPLEDLIWYVGVGFVNSLLFYYVFNLNINESH